VSIDGSGQPRSRASRRRAATDRSRESMVSMSRTRASPDFRPPRPRSSRPISLVYPANLVLSIGIVLITDCLNVGSARGVLSSSASATDRPRGEQGRPEQSNQPVPGPANPVGVRGTAEHVPMPPPTRVCAYVIARLCARPRCSATCRQRIPASDPVAQLRI
jgi:hypothetical protein